MPFIEANGERLGYLREGTGPAVLLIHSMGGDGGMWRDQVAALRERYDCIAFDCRGHGASSYNAPFSVAGVAGDLKAGLDRLGVASCHVVALAMGVPIAVSLAARFPAAVRSLVLADGFVDMREAGGARIPDWAKTIRATPMAEFGRRYVEMRLMPSVAPAVRDAFAAAIAHVTPEAYIDTMKAIFEIAFTGELASITQPALVIWGEKDDVTPLAHSRQIADGIAGARLETIPGAGHISNLDEPAAFNRLVGAFLDAQPR